MNDEQITTSDVDAESFPWFPLTPYSGAVMLKALKIEPVRGTVITRLKAPAGTRLPRHHHGGTVNVDTIQGQWRYLEHDRTAAPGRAGYLP